MFFTISDQNVTNFDQRWTALNQRKTALNSSETALFQRKQRWNSSDSALIFLLWKFLVSELFQRKSALFSSESALFQRKSALFQRWFWDLKICVFSAVQSWISAVQRFSGNEQRWNRPESILNQSWSALNVSETSTRGLLIQIIHSQSYDSAQYNLRERLIRWGKIYAGKDPKNRQNMVVVIIRNIGFTIPVSWSLSANGFIESLIFIKYHRKLLYEN